MLTYEEKTDFRAIIDDYRQHHLNNITNVILYAIARACLRAESEGEANYLATKYILRAFSPLKNKKKLECNANGRPFYNLERTLCHMSNHFPMRWVDLGVDTTNRIKQMAGDLMDVAGRHYLYIFVRQDICPEQQAVQAAHATFVAGAHIRADHVNNKNRVSGKFNPAETHFVLIGVSNRYDLETAYLKCDDANVETHRFYEKDLNHEITAFTTEIVGQADRHLFKEYGLLKFDRKE